MQIKITATILEFISEFSLLNPKKLDKKDIKITIPLSNAKIFSVGVISISQHKHFIPLELIKVRANNPIVTIPL